MIRFTVDELGLPQYRICQDMTGKYFVQELVKKGGFWSFSGHISYKWVTQTDRHDRVEYYDTSEGAARDIETILITNLQKKCQKEGLYDNIGLCLHIDLDEMNVTKRLREELDEKN